MHIRTQALPPDSNQEYVEVSKEMARVRVHVEGLYNLQVAKMIFNEWEGLACHQRLAIPETQSLSFIFMIGHIQLHHGLQDTPRAIALLQGVLGTHPSHMDEEGINLLAELCSVTKRYQEVFSVSLYMCEGTCGRGGRRGSLFHLHST